LPTNNTTIQNLERVMSEFAKIRQLEQKEAQAWEDARKKAEVIKACIFSHV